MTHSHNTSRKLQKDDILKKDARLTARQLDEKDVTKLIEETKRKQDEVLSLKDVNEDSLRAVVQL